MAPRRRQQTPKSALAGGPGSGDPQTGVERHSPPRGPSGASSGSAFPSCGKSQLRWPKKSRRCLRARAQGGGGTGVRVRCGVGTELPVCSRPRRGSRASPACTWRGALRTRPRTERDPGPVSPSVRCRREQPPLTPSRLTLFLGGQQRTKGRASRRAVP